MMLIRVFTVLVFAVLLSSCGGEECVQDDFVGSWKLEDFTCSSVNLSPAPLITFNPGGTETSVNFAGIELPFEGCTLLISGLGEYKAENGNIRFTSFVANCDAIYVRI